MAEVGTLVSIPGETFERKILACTGFVMGRRLNTAYPAKLFDTLLLMGHDLDAKQILSFPSFYVSSEET